MDDERIDLSALDPLRDADRVDAQVRAILERARPALAARRARRLRTLGFWEQLGAFRGPVLAAAAALTVTSAIVLVRVPAPAARIAATRSASIGATASAVTNPAATGSAESRTLMESAGVPPSVAHWVDRGEAPAATDLLQL